MKVHKRYLNHFCLGALCLVFPLQISATQKNWKSPQEAYTKICAYCHNTGVGPDSVKLKFTNKEDIEFRAKHIVNTVRSGMNAMPAFRKTEIDNLTLKELAQGLAKGNIK